MPEYGASLQDGRGSCEPWEDSGYIPQVESKALSGGLGCRM